MFRKAGKIFPIIYIMRLLFSRAWAPESELPFPLSLSAIPFRYPLCDVSYVLPVVLSVAYRTCPRDRCAEPSTIIVPLDSGSEALWGSLRLLGAQSQCLKKGLTDALTSNSAAR